ncbi:hypothetical protein LguiA_003246 [Lonicera macranthoides]
MSDIAMLVAEEYEKRVKKSRTNGDGSEEINLFSSVSLLAKRLNYGSDLINNIENLEIVKKVLEPKTLVGLHAINGFFSA